MPSCHQNTLLRLMSMTRPLARRSPHRAVRVLPQTPACCRGRGARLSRFMPAPTHPLDVVFDRHVALRPPEPCRPPFRRARRSLAALLLMSLRRPARALPGKDDGGRSAHVPFRPVISATLPVSLVFPPAFPFSLPPHPTLSPPGRGFKTPSPSGERPGCGPHFRFLSNRRTSFQSVRLLV